MPNKFRRGARVWHRASADRVYFGTVINAKPDTWGYIRVRWDHQQQWEKGSTCKEEQVELLQSDETQYHLRHFNIMWLTHDNMKELRAAKLSPDLHAKIMSIDGFVP